MRYFVTHDGQGNIVSLVIGPSDGPIAALDAEPGMFTEVVEAGELDLDIESPDSDQRLQDIFQQFQADALARGSFRR